MSKSKKGGKREDTEDMLAHRSGKGGYTSF